MSALELEVFHSFDDVPVEHGEPELDGDDAGLRFAPWANPSAPPIARGELELPRIDVRPSTTPPQLAARRVVPYRGPLKKGSRGLAVKALERALWRMGVREKLVKGGALYFGAGMDTHLRAAQRRKHIAVDGVYGPEAHRALAPYYDANAIALLNRVDARTPAQKRLADFLTACMILYNRRGIVGYTQGPARMTIVRHRLTLERLQTYAPILEDCSSSLTGARYLARLPDANGLGYNGQGFTGSMVAHGRRVPPSMAPLGALGFYGRGWPYSHVVGKVGTSRWFSHGSESGPRIVDLFYRGDLATVHVYDGLPA